MHPLTPEQTCALLEAARGEQFEGVFVLAVTTGLREGELLGLRWQDVDLHRRSLSVRQQLIRTGNDDPSFRRFRRARRADEA